MLESIIQIFPVHIRQQIQQAFVEAEESEDSIEEIRIRIGRPVELLSGKRSKYLKKTGSPILTTEKTDVIFISEDEIQDMVTFLSKYSLYAFTEEIRNGYLTLEGGHRVGIAGQVRMEEGEVADITYIRFLNIRIAGERKGCAKELVPYLIQSEGIYNTLLLSAPGIGKSTFLRDSIRLLSDAGIRISLVDERSEIAACYMGCPQNDVGRCTDVMDRCAKPSGMRMMLRAMAPQILAVDELGTREDYEAVRHALNCGCRILGTIHAGNIEELVQKESMRNWVEGNVFDRYVVLSKAEDGERQFEIYNGALERIC